MKKPNMFFGWWIVVAAAYIGFSVVGIITFGFTAFFEPIANETGWSYASISFASSIRGIEVGLLAPVTGILADRWGPRRIMVIGIIITASGLFLLSKINSLALFFLSFVLIATGTSSCHMAVPLTAVANWFHKNVGTASGIVVSGAALGGLAIPLLVRLIDSVGWRDTVSILAVGILVTALPLSLLIRHKPEQYGYLPDGRGKEETVSVQNISPQPSTKPRERDLTARQALKTSIYWRIILSYLILVTTIFAVITHIMPYLSTLGIERSRASVAATAMPLVTIAGRIGLGWFGDRIDRRFTAVGIYVMACVGLLFFNYVSDSSQWMLVFFLIFFGIGYGGMVILLPSLIREYFGRSHFGAIVGVSLGITSIGSLAGPPIAGWVFDTWSSYHNIWLIFSGLCLVAPPLFLSLPKLKRS